MFFHHYLLYQLLNGSVYTAQFRCPLFIGLFKVINLNPKVVFLFKSFLVLTVKWDIKNIEWSFMFLRNKSWKQKSILEPDSYLAGWIKDPDPRHNELDWFHKAYLICSAVPPDDAFVIAQAASFLVLNSALDWMSIRTGNMLASITALNVKVRVVFLEG